MLKTLLATTALASLLALGARAQDAPTVPEDQKAPLVQTEDGQSAPLVQNEMAPADAPATEDATPAVPDTADDVEAAPDATMAQEPADGGAAPLQEGWSEVDIATISADTLIGTDIRTYDQDRVASVEDVLMTPEGQVENVVARFGGFLGFGETTVLVSMDEITVVRDDNDNVFVLTDLTPDALKNRPEYHPSEG